MHFSRSMKSEFFLMEMSFSSAILWSCRSFRLFSASLSFWRSPSTERASSWTSPTNLHSTTTNVVLTIPSLECLIKLFEQHPVWSAPSCMNNIRFGMPHHVWTTSGLECLIMYRQHPVWSASSCMDNIRFGVPHHVWTTSGLECLIMYRQHPVCSASSCIDNIRFGVPHYVWTAPKWNSPTATNIDKWRWGESSP